MLSSRVIVGLVLISASLHTWADDKKNNSAYARLNVNAQLSDKGEGSFTEIRGNNSWLGVKGKVDFEEGLYAIYRLEWKVDTTAESGQDSITERPQYLGIGGKAGELTMGRNFTALWMAQGGLDLYNHYQGDIARIWRGENRLTDVATYTSPKFNNFSAVVTYQAEKEEEGKSATSAALFYGDKQFKHSPFYASLAHDFDVKGNDVTRLAFQYKHNIHKVGFMLQQQEPTDVPESESEQGAFVSYSLLLGKFDYRLQYQTMDEDRSVNLGVDYRLSKLTKFFVWFHGLDKREQEEQSYFAFGFEHKFNKGF
ncbi:Outer membrane protein (porin) [Alteromonadaceae bacterium Bs31]|nr:Outer membrane protein (porin) [Alteromonadaceae bacterium Bs31]